jgi:SAM-dependent methyltransferase
MSSILDVACGIGTQALGLAQRGYDITASDLSPEEIARAEREARKRHLSITFSTADMREAFFHHNRQFDLVIACDNSVPHLLTDDDILQAFQQFYQCLQPQGGCIISVRDYEQEDLTTIQVKPYGVRYEHGVRWVLSQLWEPHGSLYDFTMYIIEDAGTSDCRTHALQGRYYAISISKLMNLMTTVGFEDVRRIDGRFFQPVIIGTRP